MRYAAPVAMPAGLGEWLGAELEARGVELASLYARAVLSILLHSETTELTAEAFDSYHHHHHHYQQQQQQRRASHIDRTLAQEQQQLSLTSWNPSTALELELRLDRHAKEDKARRGRPSKKNLNKNQHPNKHNSSHGHQRSSNMPANKQVSFLVISILSVADLNSLTCPNLHII